MVEKFLMIDRVSKYRSGSLKVREMCPFRVSNLHLVLRNKKRRASPVADVPISSVPHMMHARRSFRPFLINRRRSHRPAIVLFRSKDKLESIPAPRLAPFSFL